MSLVAGKGTLLQMEISGSYTTIAQRVEISGPDISVGILESKDLDRDWVTRIASGVKDGGELGLKIEYDPAATTHAALLSAITADPPVEKNWKLIFADSGAKFMSFAGIVSGFKAGGMTVDGLLEADVKIMVSGEITMPA